jgi:ATP-binding cassette subfamily F protein 3
VQLGETPDDEALLRRYGNLDERFSALGGYAAESEAARICANLGLPDRVLEQPLSTLSGGQRRRVELARILFADSGAEPTTLLLDEPTNHLDADSIVWLRDFLRQHTGGLVLISHDVTLLDAVVNKVWYLDANRSAVDVYNVNWKTYLKQREADEKRRVRERANAERKIDQLKGQADKMRAKATKARAAHQMDRRAAALAAGLDAVRVSDKVARLRFPAPAPCGKTPLTAEGLSKSYGSLEVFAGVDLAIDRGARVVVLGLNGAGKTTLLRMLSGVENPDTGEVIAGHGLRLGYYAQEHETLDHDRTILENMRTSASAVGRSDLNDTELRKILGAFLFTGDDVDKPAGVLSGGEKTRLALAMLVTSAANVLLLDEPTNNLDPVSRGQVLDALHTFAGAIVLVTHDEGAVEALSPDKVILLPDGVEDQWSPDLAELITLA